jgi:predicted nucleic acid-binding protein
MKPIVIDTGSLITLERINAIQAIGQLPFEFIAPEEVRIELEAGANLGYPRINPTWLCFRQLQTPLSPMVLSALDDGEADVIQLALEQKIRWVCIDECKARRVARFAGLDVAGVLGLLGMAKKRGIIPALRPFVEQAVRRGIRYHPELIRKVLEAAGE